MRILSSTVLTFLLVFELCSSSKGYKRTKYVKQGGWHTLEEFVDAGGKGYFKRPAGANVKVRYGVGFLGTDSQQQKLDGRTVRQLNVAPGWAPLLRARMQVKVKNSGKVKYEVVPQRRQGSPPAGIFKMKIKRS